jgi:hypothetical protein
VPPPSGAWLYGRPFLAFFVATTVAYFLHDLLETVKGDRPTERWWDILVIVVISSSLIGAFRPVSQTRWYILIPAIALGGGLGGHAGRAAAAFVGKYLDPSIRAFIEAALLVLTYVKRRALLFGFFAAGYLTLVGWFAALLHLVWLHDRSAFNGLGANPGAADFLFLSIATIATIGDGRTSAATDWARLALGAELVVGFLWNTLVLASVAAEVGRAVVAAREGSAKLPDSDPTPPSPS